MNSHLKGYLERFRTRLGAGNRRYIQMLMVLIQAFLRCLLGNQDNDTYSQSVNAPEDVRSVEMAEKDTKKCDLVMTINEFLFSLDIDNINLIKLWRYLKESNIIHKVSSYGEKWILLESGSWQGECGAGEMVGARSSALSGFHVLADLLLALTNADRDGRIIVARRTTANLDEYEEGYLKFVMLDAETLFSEIVDQAHTVVLAGGTLQPVDEMKERLFPHVQPDRLHLFSCGHIVPPESVLPIAISRGPTGRTFDFTYT